MPVTVVNNEITDVQQLYTILSDNKDLIILKFSAEWCGPCKNIAPLVEKWKNTLNESVHFYEIDIDESINLYMYLKNRKMLNGIPAILCWRKGNATFIPDYLVNTSDLSQVNNFFENLKLL